VARILILGSSGQVASALRTRLPEAGHEVVALGRSSLDLSDPAAARTAVLECAPDVVINAAAYTAVDRAESDETAARALNADGPAAASAAAAQLSAPFIHFSTDYVFDGSKGAPYVEDDPPCPLGIYGETKLAGERSIAEANPRHVILRTAWVCSPGGANFLRTMLRLAAERDAVAVVDDQKGRPTFARDLAGAVTAIVERLDSRPHAEAYGVFHAASQGDTTWCGFARAIMEGSAARGGPAARVQAITTAEFPTPARRPADSRLATDKLAAIYGIRLPHWRDALEACLNDIYSPVIRGAV
jgi:dTDP-4-dehydrorhamnose reductase